jgi:rubrerythrin
MTVKSDLQQAIAACESAKGCYAMMSQATEDPQAKQMYDQMTSDVNRHLQYLDGRLNYLDQNNKLNQQNQQPKQK